MKIFNIQSLNWLVFIGVLTFIAACNKMDDYKKFIEDRPVITYTGKIDSVKVYSGENRVLIKGLLISDPKIQEVRIYWNNRRDSVSIPVQRSLGVDTIRQYITGLADGVYNFEIVTFDSDGNRSVRVSALGRSYGENYQLGIVNRPITGISQFTIYNRTLTARFGNLDLSSGIYATDIHFTNLDGEEEVFRLSTESADVLVDGIDHNLPISYRSIYAPDTLSIDTFYTDFSVIKPELVFYKNLQVPFTAHNISGRWGVLSDWMTNSAANGINGRGSADSNTGSRVMSAEAGWGTPNIPNGKMYQTASLPKGRFKVLVEYTRNNVTAGDDNMVYFLAAEDAAIPNAVDVKSAELLGYTELKWIADGYREASFEFENAGVKDITVGMVVNFTSASNQFINVRKIKVTKIDDRE